MIILLALLIPFLGTTGTVLLGLICAIGAYFYFKIKKAQSFWEKQGVPHVKPKFLRGNMEIIKTKPFADVIQDIYNAFPDERYFGAYQFVIPLLVVKDPDLIKTITVKRFDHFVNRRALTTTETDGFWARNLVATRDDRWHDLRSTLSPSFTSSKMRTMFKLMDDCARQFVRHFQDGASDLETKDVFSRYSNDVIASAAFGLKCDSLEDQTNDFFLMGNKALNLGGPGGIKFIICSLSPKLAKLLKIKMVPESVEEFFSKIIKDTVKVREEKRSLRPDMIHLLMEAQKGRQHQEEDLTVNEGFSSVCESDLHRNRNKGDITLDDIVSQAFIFFLAGFETVSTLLSFAFYELAINEDVQRRLREEINTVPEDVTYETLLGLKYLDMVVSEALRKWPPGLVVNREVSKAFTIEPERPGEKPIRLEKGQVCWLPIYAIHRDPKHYPEPEKFDPERFSDENKHKINPALYLPFGAGPRNCIGSRFALLESKIIIFHILKNFEVTTTRKTPIPMVLEKSPFRLVAKGGIWLGFKKIAQS